MLPHLLELLPAELVAHANAHGVALRLDEARRILVDAHAPPGQQRRRKPVARAKQAAVAELTRHDSLEVLERATDPSDGFVKYLLRGRDGDVFEAVRIPLHAPGRFSVCLSSQAGCAMRCAFCATGRLGLRRHLDAWEMVATLELLRNEAPGRVTGAVFQGQGEPLHNYDAVMKAARVLCDPCGAHVAAKAITVSTVGLVPQIRRFTAERQPYRLIASITTTQPDRRTHLLPVASRLPFDELVAALREHAEATGKLLTIAWVMMAGVNTDPAEIEGLRRAFAGVPFVLNLIDVNDARPDGFARAGEAERTAFIDGLSAAGIPFRRRYSGGAARHAACGMLAGHRAAS
ncbi:radical SAM protein [Paraliomyxa miuraensis]|uniref:radical SAM protein n=1 Tax=Paraliomyxa miuraensis TaxID=376150 RepID=UPI002258D622|nr:radical SAM protein [Paraliomyxa miuraensis]MCX4245018.1 radical SAM protein [Paraliomyxa miuraensis]